MVITIKINKEREGEIILTQMIQYTKWIFPSKGDLAEVLKGCLLSVRVAHVEN